MTELAISRDQFSRWKHGLCWLLLLGPLFFLTYGLVNQFTATRHDVGWIVFSWEHAIPFMPWTIVPYWSIDILYGISLFICSSRQELTRHGYRLLAASLIACCAFLLFPLKFTFVRPETEGIFGWLFRQLEQFDLPYNQAPSLHIILAWLLWLRFRQHLRGCGAQAVLGGWFLLIAISVLTTWQHHFIDVPSGMVTAIFISYAIPIAGKWRWRRPSAQAVRLALKYAIGGAALLLAGLTIPYGEILLWPALSLFIVAVGYAGLGAAVFQKNAQGQLSLSARLLLLPYLAGARLSMRWFSRRLAKTSAICDGIYLGGFPETEVRQSAVLDLTAEFHKEIKQTWCAYPLMDLVAPDERSISNAVAKLSCLRQTHDTVLVCCALGLSRSATIVAAWLLAQGKVTSVKQAVELIRSQRPQVVLTPAHMRALEQFQDRLCQTSR
ncbi:phosphatase PAP2/dual specificity phosphatase family protein [Brenneria izadpanahii]|uniref:Phosphatase PAP2/dual specificity phosphatase family protein n=1 Tax=Brenneria izadpanahii TaxID=2722756 RepID=A0ABX7UTR5_9GAMM|nr:phosphatase PAP2/dual specificity phosphatase family protein [Brenneria izadpanahii]QTF07580.1 phosphatase PAP2/dual specificity phosphatase family protein [Brenneria izadpanahii]